MKQPLVSIIIPTKDSSKLLPECLSRIKKQTYKNIEIIVSDGHSKDNTRLIAKKYDARVIDNPDILAEPGVYRGMSAAKGELLMILAVDNIFIDKKAIEKIAAIFSDKKIYAAFPKHDSVNTDTIFSKYINTFTDPATHFLFDYAANARTFKKIYKTIIHTDNYDVYDFSTNHIKPVLALAQGFTVRKEFIKNKRNEMDDISPVWDLIKEKKQIAYVHSVSLIHHTIRDMVHFIRKQRWAMRNSLEKKTYGLTSREDTLTIYQKIKMYLYPFYAISIILPFARSIWHMVIDGEFGWFSHTFIVFVSGLAIWYEYATITLLKRDISVSRQ